MPEVIAASPKPRVMLILVALLVVFLLGFVPM